MSFNANTQEHDAQHESLPMETFPVLEHGIYLVTLESISSLVTTFGDTLKFTWRVKSGESAGETFNGLANKRLTPKSKLATWAKAHLGITAFPDGFTLTLTSLIGKQVYVTLTVEPKTDGTGDRNVVSAIAPVRPPRTVPVSQPATANPTNLVTDEEIADPGTVRPAATGQDQAPL